jgi:hypothetical protein
VRPPAPPAKRRLVDRIADVFVLLPAGFGALVLILDLVESHVRGSSDLDGPFALVVGVAMTATLEVWFRAEDRWARRRRRDLGARATPPALGGGGWNRTS